MRRGGIFSRQPKPAGAGIFSVAYIHMYEPRRKNVTAPGRICLPARRRGISAPFIFAGRAPGIFSGLSAYNKIMRTAFPGKAFGHFFAAVPADYADGALPPGIG